MTPGCVHPEAEFVVDGEIPDVELLANGLLPSVFRNLLNNAVQHNDTRDPEIVVSVDDTPTDVTVRVADNGPGIPDDRKESVFGEAARGLASSSTGMGLYLAATLVRDVGGEIWVEDNEPRGSVFNVELPRPE